VSAGRETMTPVGDSRWVSAVLRHIVMETATSPRSDQCKPGGMQFTLEPFSMENDILAHSLRLGQVWGNLCGEKRRKHA
jgi:hypothetical protein